MDITLHCVDAGDLKNKGLAEVSPSMCKFNQVSHCAASRRIAGKNLIGRNVWFLCGYQCGFNSSRCKQWPPGDLRAAPEQVPDDSGPHETGHGAGLQPGREVFGELLVRREPTVVLADEHRNVRPRSVADTLHQGLLDGTDSGRGPAQPDAAGKVDLDQQPNRDADAGRRFRDAVQRLSAVGLRLK